MSLKDQQPDDSSAHRPNAGDQLDNQLRDRLRDHSSPVRSDVWRGIQNGLAALGTQPGTRPSQRGAIPVVPGAAPEATPSYPAVAPPARRLTTYRPYLALIVAACLFLLVGSPYLRHRAAPHPTTAHGSPGEASAKAGKSTAAPKKAANIATTNAPSGTSRPATPTASAAPSPVAKASKPPATVQSPEKAPSTTSAPPERSSAATPLLTSKMSPARPTHPMPHVSPARRHRPAAAQTADAASIPTQATKPFFPRERSSLTLPALAKFTTRKTVTFPLPVSIQHPARPNPYAGASLFDHFYLSLFGATGFPTHYYALSYTGGIRLSFQFDRHWSATSGIQVSRVGYHPIRDTDYGILPGHFINLDLPLLVGYTFAGNHYNFTINSGAIVNLYSRAFRLVREPWPNRTGPSAYLGLAYTRPLNDQWSVFAEPYVRCLFTRNEPILPARTWSTGLQLGLKYHL